MNNGTGSWAVVTQADGRLAGAILLVQLPDHQGQLTADYEIGWHFRRSAWGKGYATEAAQALIHYGFNQLNLPEIYAVVKPENYRSIQVTQRLGMMPLGLTHKYYNTELLLFRIKIYNNHR
ncbi:MAG: GNAT family N-acetyltransferase [Oscillatoriales cyanobacterium SM2_3_0]|nr:GNAT family N-acetyltransferase [Oscillatoriales cyanobacterium SM2_3_0]